jgi:hypothetical protein
MFFMCVVVWCACGVRLCACVCVCVFAVGDGGVGDDVTLKQTGFPKLSRIIKRSNLNL